MQGVPRGSAAARRRWREPSSQGLVLGWCLWLLGSWAATLQIESAVAAVRWMVFACILGLLALWPMIRLAQDFLGRDQERGDFPRSPGELSRARLRIVKLIFQDWLTLNLVFQVVIWPMRLSPEWGLEQTLWLDAAVASWSLLTGALIAMGSLGDSGWQRLVAMTLCVLVLMGEPVLMALTSIGSPRGTTGWTMSVSPFQALWALTEPPAAFRAELWQPRVVSVAVAALAAWAIVVLFARQERESAERVVG